MENISLTTPYTSIENYGTLTVGNSLLSYVTNSGSLTFNQNLKISSTATNAGGAYENNGTITVNGNTELPARYSRITNNGSFTVNGDLSSSAEGTSNVVVNNCKLIVSGNYLIQGASSSTNNYAYLKVGGEMKIRNGGKLNVYSGSMINTKDITVLANIASVGSTSLIKATGRTLVGEPGGPTTLGSYPTISGALKLCATNVVTNVGTWTNGAGLGCNVDIPVSGCNPEGNGTLAVVDSDGDGIANNLDDFPTDASKAFISYYPAGGAENAGATVLFEDMWPSKGDYDMNDVVLSYNLRIITNAQNKVAAVDGTYSLRARGGTYQNGFGIEFPISRSLVSNVNGGMLESGHQKAVIILFQNMHEQLSSMNTNTADPVAAPKVFPISFTVTNGPLLSEFGLGEYNPFIWNKGNSRGHEVHLPGKTPTALANTSLFGTGDDKSVPASGKYYITASGSPWAISIPVKNFLYPQEGKDIVSAYLKLPDWIASGGTSYTDWYTNESSGYRNSGNLFIK
jgi:LruC domain-containing protein